MLMKRNLSEVSRSRRLADLWQACVWRHTQRVRPEAAADQNVDVPRERAVMGLAQAHVEHRNSMLSPLHLPMPSSCPISYFYLFPDGGFVSLALALFPFGVHCDPGVECLQQSLQNTQKVSQARARALFSLHTFSQVLVGAKSKIWTWRGSKYMTWHVFGGAKNVLPAR